MLFLKYIKYRKKLIFALLVFFLTFALTFYFYELPLEAVIYPELLCLLFGAIFALFDCITMNRRHKKIMNLCLMTSEMINELPDAGSIEGEDLQKLISVLQDEIRNIKGESDAGYANMVEYYTIWAHQIKTPLASMRLTLQNKLDSDSILILKSDLFRIEQYVEMVLAYLRLESESSDYLFREYSLDAIIRPSVKKFIYEFIGKKISLRYKTIEKTVVTDEKWLTFVIEQIISNSLKYTREGSISIYLRDYAFLCIEDTGIGIAPEDLPRIFENGYTGYNGRSDKKASGIGLYLCKRICDRLGIGISASSEIGKGTVITLDLRQYSGVVE